MRATVKSHLPAIACAATMLVCYFLIRPYAEIGICDDWSYVKTAQVLAQTGHIVYNGWAAAMLGWQAYFGALFIKLFGFSFTAIRFSTVIEAMATAFLLERICVRAGLSPRNATLATLTFVLSPLCLPWDFTFMTDVSGVLCVVVCLYMCLRAVQAESERSAMAWISFAALLNAVDGTARQITWLGVLVMVPSTLWLLRRRRRVLIAGGLSCIAGAAIVVAAMHWFARQPYTVPSSMIPASFDRQSLRLLVGQCLSAVGQLALLALPVLLMFTACLRSWNRRKATVFTAAFLCFALPGMVLIHSHNKLAWLAPFLDDYMTYSTLQRLNAIAAWGSHLAIACNAFCLFLTAAVMLGILSLVTCFFADPLAHPSPQREPDSISWQQLGIMLGPFSFAYLGPLAVRAMQGLLYDRYLMPLFAVLLLVLVLYYQQRVNANLPWACILIIAIFGGFSVAATHDEFALFRGYAAAFNEIRSTGAPATDIVGPWELQGWTEIEQTGYVNFPKIQVPKGAYVPQPARSYPASCTTLPAGFSQGLSSDFQAAWSVNFLDMAPALKPVYAVSVDPEMCGGQAAFPPAIYRTWVAPHVNSIYVVRLPPSFPR
jgi:hypothetical protein